MTSSLVFRVFGTNVGLPKAQSHIKTGTIEEYLEDRMFIRFAQPVFRTETKSPVESMIDDMFPSSFGRSSFPAVDVVEIEAEFELVAEMPGLKKEDVKISVEDRTLTLSGERKHSGFPDGTTIILHETQTHPFSRSFELPEEIDTNRIAAELKDGILRIRLPKVEKVKPQEIRIS